MGVISLNFDDFNIWRREHQLIDVELTRKNFTKNSITYFCISNMLDLHSITFDEIIETRYAKENSNYEKIMSLIDIYKK